MDTWSEQQLNQMKIGGNTKFREWFKKHDMEASDLNTKYNSNAAILLKDKIKTEASGKKWTPPTKAEVKKRTSHNNSSGFEKNYSSRGNGRMQNGQRTRGSQQRGGRGYGRPTRGSPNTRGNRSNGRPQQQKSSEWDNWGQPAKNGPTNPPSNGSTASRFGNNTSISSDAYFGREKPTNNDQVFQTDDLMNKLSLGWSSVSSALQYGAQAVADGSRSLTEQVASTDINAKLGSVAKEQSSKAWSGISSFYNQAQQSWVGDGTQPTSSMNPTGSNGGVRSSYTPPNQGYQARVAPANTNYRKGSDDEASIEVLGKPRPAKSGDIWGTWGSEPQKPTNAARNEASYGSRNGSRGLPRVQTQEKKVAQVHRLNGSTSSLPDSSTKSYGDSRLTASAVPSKTKNDDIFGWDDKKPTAPIKKSTPPATTNTITTNDSKTNMNDWGWDDDW
eukprot:CAMPEP_0168534594 /NCGR_PEP_ID=MMETSP0405-20121227/18035_1 /TAXON_ID=498012 /ORGANISM="Trichosphaerium sp, Strain Am-I-7 wt" /LENGTH=444 /DNA_ID=CAMNT_0008561415 /DNA_START=23 /DNA_END=1357 /DNA_ORIENTATION=+